VIDTIDDLKFNSDATGSDEILMFSTNFVNIEVNIDSLPLSKIVSFFKYATYSKYWFHILEYEGCQYRAEYNEETGTYTMYIYAK